jgi:2-amino-4-hydroxy-6-hydroxymethyldihydropteridine diphosphokinase
MDKSATAHLCAGSNLGSRQSNLAFARNSIAKVALIVQTSSYYETEPVGFLDQPWFLNQVIEINTHLAPLELLSVCLEIEKTGGRVRAFQNAPRTLDLDILLYGGMVINEKNLTIPHPLLAERRFVLEPLAEIAPDIMHPVLKKPIRTLLEECSDQSEVRLLNNT